MSINLLAMACPFTAVSFAFAQEQSAAPAQHENGRNLDGRKFNTSEEF